MYIVNILFKDPSPVLGRRKMLGLSSRKDGGRQKGHEEYLWWSEARIAVLINLVKVIWSMG